MTTKVAAFCRELAMLYRQRHDSVMSVSGWPGGICIMITYRNPTTYILNENESQWLLNLIDDLPNATRCVRFKFPITADGFSMRADWLEEQAILIDTQLMSSCLTGEQP